MSRARAAAVAFALLAIALTETPVEAQRSGGAAVINAAQAAAGTAKVLSVRVFAADSVLVLVEDTLPTSLIPSTGPWRFGGRVETPRVVGRAIAEAVRAALSAQSRVKLVVVNVTGTDSEPVFAEGSSRPSRGIAVRFPYSFSDPAPL